MKRQSLLLDCRWLGHGGAGRVTELLLRGLAARPRDNHWRLWGPPKLRDFAWSGAEVVNSTVDPRKLFGQRQWLEVPDCDLAVFLHQQRPLRRASSITVIHDTIPIHFATDPLAREAKRLFLRQVVSLSRLVVTVSDYSRSCIHRELAVPDEKIVVIDHPFDSQRADRVSALRRDLRAEPVALYVGNFMVHKNVPRLIEAFRKTAFCRKGGGRLVLVGAQENELSKRGVSIAAEDRRWLSIRGRCSDEELETLMATSRLLVQPSLDEGFGLPAWEALCCGLPLCVSDGGSLPEITRGLVEPFPARSVDAMAESIDRCARAATDPHSTIASDVSEELRRTSGTVGEFGEAFQDIVARFQP